MFRQVRPKRLNPKMQSQADRKAVQTKIEKSWLSPFQMQLQTSIRLALALIGLDLSVVYFVYDGALGNNAGLQAVIKSLTVSFTFNII